MAICIVHLYLLKCLLLPQLNMHGRLIVVVTIQDHSNTIHKDKVLIGSNNIYKLIPQDV